MKQTIETKLGVIVILIFAVTVGAFVWKWEKNQKIDEMQNQIKQEKNTIKNQYSNSNYGFSLNLPNPVDKYLILVSPDAIGKISFLLPATNQKYIKEYTGFAWADTFNILAYPKIEIDKIKQDCNQNPTQNKPYYKCTLINEEPIAENNTYSFYYLKGGMSYANSVPLAFESGIYTESENALKTFKISPASLIFDESIWRVYEDTKYGFQIEYPNDWSLSFHAPSLGNDNVYASSIGGPEGSIVFDNNYIEKTTSSVDANIEFLKINAKINLVGAGSIFNKIQINRGLIFYSPSEKFNMPFERRFFIVGENIILNGTFQSSPMTQEKIDKFVGIISRLKLLH